MAEIDGYHLQPPIPSLSSSLYLLPLEDDRSLRRSKRKLEDYLDPFLLHTISSRIGRTEMKEKPIEKKDVFVEKNRRRIEFDWPVDRLQPLINDPNLRGSGKTKTTDHGCLIISERRRSDFPIWKVDDNKQGA